MNMKEFDLAQRLMLRQNSASTRELTTQAREGYSMGGGIFMPEPGTGDVKEPEGVREATRRLEAAAEAGRQASVRKLLGQPNLPVEIKGAIDEITGGGKPPEEPPAPPTGEQPPTSESGGEGGESRSNLREPGEIQENKLIRAIKRVEEAPADQRKERIKEVLGWFSPHQSPLPDQIVDFALEFEETLDNLLARIVTLPLDLETSAYQVGWFADINLSTIIETAKRKMNQAKDDNERLPMKKRSEMASMAKEALPLLHNMNMTVIIGSQQQSVQMSESILPKHFTYWRDTLGASEVKRAYEQKYHEFFERYGRIPAQNSEELIIEVEKYARLLNEKGLLGTKKMEEWELGRALSIGRKFFHITFRSSELISTGNVPAGMEEKEEEGYIKELRKVEEIIKDPKKTALEKEQAEKDKESLRRKLAEAEIKEKQRWNSLPNESWTRFMNPLQWLAYRFKIAGPRGGLEFLGNVKKKYFEYLRTRGLKLGKNKITRLGGRNVEDMETAGIFGESGVISSWRAENLLFTSKKILIGGRTVREWIAEHKPDILRIKDDFKNAKKKNNVKDIESAQDKFAEELQPLIDNVHVGLGILLKQSIFEDEVAYKARAMLWKKIILGNTDENHPLGNYRKGNLPLVINYLSSIEMKGLDMELLKQIRLDNGFTDSTKWEAFRTKILIQHERNVKEAVGIDVSAISQEYFDASEVRLINAIKTVVKDLAPDLADIVFPHMPFLNDAPFELFDYSQLGQEVYKRRISGDYSKFYEAINAFIKLMNNPGGIGMEEGMKAFDELVKGIESPQGTGDAQKRVLPVFDAWLDWITAYPGFFSRQAMWKSIQEAIRKPTSLAQQYSGTTAPSLNETQERAMLDEALKIGILSQEFLDELKKKKGLLFFNIIAVLLRDFFYVPVVHGAWEYSKATSKLQQ